MLTKELLCLSESGYNGPTFTHTLSNIKKGTSYVQANTVTPPNITINGVELEISYLSSEHKKGREEISLRSSKGYEEVISSLLYYACFDRDKNYGGVAPMTGSRSVVYRWSSNDHLLSEDDVGKTVNVWLSTEPPPWV